MLPSALKQQKNVTGLEDTCKKLQASVDELGLKIANLSQSYSNLVMEIESASESFTESSQAEPTFVPPRPATAIMDIIDELADLKRNIIFYQSHPAKVTVMLLSPYVPQYTVVLLLLLDHYGWERKLINLCLRKKISLNLGCMTHYLVP